MAGWIGDIASALSDVVGAFNGGNSSSSQSSASTTVNTTTTVNPVIAVDTQGVKDSVQTLVNSLSGFQQTQAQIDAVKIISDAQNAEAARKATITAAVIGAFVFVAFRR